MSRFMSCVTVFGKGSIHLVWLLFLSAYLRNAYIHKASIRIFMVVGFVLMEKLETN